MEIKAVKDNDIIRVKIDGLLDLGNAMKLEQAFLSYAPQGKHFVLDFSAVEFISSAGIRALLTLYREVSAKDGSVTVENAQPQVREVMVETEFDQLFNMK